MEVMTCTGLSTTFHPKSRSAIGHSALDASAGQPHGNPCGLWSRPLCVWPPMKPLPISTTGVRPNSEPQTISVSSKSPLASGP